MPNERTPHDRTARNRARRAALWDRLHGVRGGRRLVVPPAPVCPVRAHRLLRHLAVTARERARGGHRAPGHPQLRAGGGLVLELCDRRVLRVRPGADPTGPPSPRPAGTRSGRPGAARLARPPALAVRTVRDRPAAWPVAGRRRNSPATG